MNSIGYIFDGGSGRALSPKAELVARYLIDHPNRIIPREDLAQILEFEANGRVCDTYIAEIRKALGKQLDRIVSKPKVGYGWIGAPVALVACVKEHVKPCADPLTKLVVMPQSEVARRLKIPLSEVHRLEKSALKKMRERPELMDAWRQMQKDMDRIKYDPFHEIWLFSVGDNHEIR